MKVGGIIRYQWSTVRNFIVEIVVINMVAGLGLVVGSNIRYIQHILTYWDG